MINKSTRRKKNYWTKKETELLKDAVSNYGKKWSIIQQKNPEFKENGRTQIDLKDKWRNLNGRSKIMLDSSDYETLNYIIANRHNYQKTSKRKSKTSKRKSKTPKRKSKYIIYSKEGCPYCKDAKELLKSKNILFKEIKITDSNIQNIYKKIDSKTKNYRYFPIIFKNDIFIGGFSELKSNL